MKLFHSSLLLTVFCAGQTLATPLGSGFTYQGKLNDGGAPANGNYDMIFNLYDAPTNGNVFGTFSIFAAVPVGNGVFTVELNSYGEFGTNAFNGQARWLQIGVRTNSNNALNNFVFLNPRQPLDPAPYALFAQSAAVAQNAVAAQNAAVAQNAVNAQSAASVTGSVAASQIAGVLSPNNFGAGTITSVALADGSVTPAKAPGLLAAVAHDGTLRGDGTVATPLGLQVPMALTASSAKPIIAATNTNPLAEVILGVGGNSLGNNHAGGNAIKGVGGDGLDDFGSPTDGGAGVVGIGGRGGEGFYWNGHYGSGVEGYSQWGSGVLGSGETGVSGVGSFIGVSGHGSDMGVVGSASNLFGVGVWAANAVTNNATALLITGGIAVADPGGRVVPPVFTHKVTAANIEAGNSHRTTITNPHCDGNPSAFLFITHVYNSPGGPGVIETNPTGVTYNAGLGKWQIYHENAAAMQINANYNVFIVKRW